MTEFELNKAIARQLGYRVKSFYGSDTKIKCNNLLVVDYCNNWNDLMPLVEKYRLDVEWSEAGALVSYFEIEVATFDENCKPVKSLKRALAECLLKALQAKKELTV
jgi:hypothetical protein